MLKPSMAQETFLAFEMFMHY